MFFASISVLWSIQKHYATYYTVSTSTSTTSTSICLSTISCTLSSGHAPTNWSTTALFFTNVTCGMLVTAYVSANDWFSSISRSIFAITILPGLLSAILCNIGHNILHGPHRSAQKSISTSSFLDAKNSSNASAQTISYMYVDMSSDHTVKLLSTQNITRSRSFSKD